MKLRYAESVVSAWLFAACANMHGGQSGDDGDVIDRGGEGPASENPMPQDPDQDGCSEKRELDATTPSQLGKTPSELIAEIVPQSLPLHWVAYDASSFDVDYEPGVGQTTLALSLALRTPAATAETEEQISEFVPNSGDALTPDCAVPRVRAPIWLALTSSDGAFDEKIPGTAVLYGNSIAEVTASLPYDDLAGSFRFAPAVSNDARETWAPTQLVVRAQLWPGGSAGMIYPEFVPTKRSGNNIPVAQPPPDLPSDVEVTTTPRVPAQWDAVAVWPRLEQCALGVARTPSDAVVGVSAQGVLDELSAQSSCSLTIAENKTGLATTALSSDVALTALPALLCVTVDPLHQTLVFTVPAHLRAVDDASETTEIDAQLEVSLLGQTNSRALTGIQFERALSETAAPTSRSEFEAATGMSLESIDPTYSQFWWTWYGHLTRNTAVGTWDQETHLVVTSPNAEETRLVAEQVAQGGPGFGVSSGEQSVQLPGDVLFHAAGAP